MNGSIPEKAQELLKERFGHDTLIALATVTDGIPSVRTVNSYYEDGKFYVITYAKSAKMKQLEANPNTAVSGDWFSAHGIGMNLGWFGKSENRDIAVKLRHVFKDWIDNGHNNFDDENTVILCIQLTDGTLFSHGTRYDLDFSEK